MGALLIGLIGKRGLQLCPSGDARWRLGGPLGWRFRPGARVAGPPNFL